MLGHHGEDLTQARCTTYANVGFNSCGCAGGGCAIFTQTGSTVSFSEWYPATQCNGAATFTISNVSLNNTCTTFNGGMNTVGISATSGSTRAAASLFAALVAVAAAVLF